MTIVVKNMITLVIGICVTLLIACGVVIIGKKLGRASVKSSCIIYQYTAEGVNMYQGMRCYQLSQSGCVEFVPLDRPGFIAYVCGNYYMERR